jgi:hypothetical protein
MHSLKARKRPLSPRTLYHWLFISVGRFCLSTKLYKYGRAHDYRLYSQRNLLIRRFDLSREGCLSS